MSKLLEIGSNAPDFTLQSARDGAFSLSRDGGEFVTVITFFRGEW